MYHRTHFVPALFLGPAAPMLPLDCPSRIGRNSAQRLSGLLEQVGVVTVDSGELDCQRALSVGAMAINLRFERGFQIAEHKANDFVGRPRRYA
jgi:hypothetical protein